MSFPLSSFTFGAVGVAMGAAGVQAAQTATIDFADTVPVMTTSTNTTLDGADIRPQEAIGDHEISVYTDQETRDAGRSYEERRCLDGEGPACDAQGNDDDQVWTPAFVRDLMHNGNDVQQRLRVRAVNSTITSSFIRVGMRNSVDSVQILGRNPLATEGAYDEDENEDVDVEVKLPDAVQSEDEEDDVAKPQERSGAAVQGSEMDEAPRYPWEVASCASDEEKRAKLIAEEAAFFHSRGTSTRMPPRVLREKRSGSDADGERDELLDHDYYLHKESSIYDELDMTNNLMREACTLLIAAISTALVLVGRRAPTKASGGTGKDAVY